MDEATFEQVRARHPELTGVKWEQLIDHPVLGVISMGYRLKDIESEIANRGRAEIRSSTPTRSCSTSDTEDPSQH